MSKLTLSVRADIVSEAKQYAKEQGLSVSQMVEAYLASLTMPSKVHVPPVLRSMRGILKEADPEDYRRHLTRKYR
jgi:hypothetical protein